MLKNKDQRLVNEEEVEIRTEKDPMNLEKIMSEQGGMNPAYEMYYNESKRRVINCDDEIENANSDLIVHTILRYNAEDKGLPVEERTPIKIYLNTIGGDVQGAQAIIDAIVYSKTPVYTVVTIAALSAGAHILAAGHKRYAFPGATILVHSGSVYMGGDVEKAESMRRYYNKTSERFNKDLVDRTKIDPKQLKKKGAFDWYMDAEEALEQGIIDEIITDFDTII